LGYGFGTEGRVFFDRYQAFESQLVENSFVGLYLQLGAIGVLVFAALLAAIGGVGIRRRGSLPDRRRSMLAAALGVLAAGIVLMGVQSYAYSAGNLSTVPLWLAAGLVVAEGSVAARGKSSWLGTQRQLLTAVVAA